MRWCMSGRIAGMWTEGGSRIDCVRWDPCCMRLAVVVEAGCVEAGVVWEEEITSVGLGGWVVCCWRARTLD